RPGADRALRRVAAGGVELRRLHEGRALGLSPRADQLPLLDLRGLRRRLHGALRLAGLDRAARAAAMMPSPFALAVIAIVALAAMGLPIGHSMILASILYLLLAGLDPGT